MSKSLRPIGAAVGHLLVWCCIVTAQQVEESRPSVYYLPDKQGNLQPVLDFQYQDFVELYKLKNQLQRRQAPPRYSVQRMTASGTAGEEFAELSLQFEVLVRDDDWVRVPLRLDQGLLRGEVKHKGPGEQLVHYERDGDGYVCWLRGKSDTQHEVAVTMLVPLALVGDQPRLRLFVPRATVSELKLKVPLTGAIGEVSENATLLSSAAAGKDATEFNVVGLGGDFQLTWHKSNPSGAEMPLVLEATGTVLTRLDARSIVDEATLSVRSSGAAFDRFTVRLPPGAELSPGTAHGYTLTPVEKKGKPTEKRLVAVQLSKKTVGPIEVRLTCRRDYDPPKTGSWCELAGFEVVGAARQWGVAAVAAGNQWQVLWGTSREVRGVDPLPKGLRKADVVAGFEYSAQPYSLTARLTPRKIRVGVDPRYVLLVDRDMVRLEGKLTYTIRGGKVSTLEMAIPGWELDEVGPANLVAAAGVALSGNEAAIPLAQPASGTLELQLRAHHVLEAGAKSLRAALPRLQADSIAPASVAVVAADNIELTPDSRSIEGLQRQPTASFRWQEKLPARQQAPLFYRGVGAAVFAADFRVHAQQVAVDVPGQATLDRRTSEVQQRQSYSTIDRAWVQTWFTSLARQDRAVYQLTTTRRQLEVALPAGAAASDAVVRVDGNRVDARTIADDRLLVPLPGLHADRTFVVELRYQFTGPRPPPGVMAVEFPRIGPDAWARRIYWQLVLPVNEHLTANPEGFAGEFTWDWQSYFWGRQPLLDQAQLEDWAGVGSRTALPDRTNLYLFSTIGDLQQAEVHTAGRAWIVLWGSGAALVAGLLLIYVPASRRPATLLVASVLLLAAGLIATEPTLLLAQAASLGLVLALLAGMLERGVTRRLRRTRVHKEPHGALAEVGSTHAPRRAPPVNGHVSTETMPTVPSQSLGNGDP